MDCDTARLFLQFTHPHGDDLGAAEAEELHAHLEQCSACNAQAMNARRLDAHLGRAMLAVPMPAGLKARLGERLAEERGVIQRRWVRRIASAVASAACLLIMLWGYTRWSQERAKNVDLEYVVERVNLGGHGQDSANDALRRLGARRCAPDFVDYAYLTGEPALAEAPGYTLKVPQLVFTHNSRRAIVYAIPSTERPPPAAVVSGSGYRYKAAVRQENGYTYLILYDGDDWNWLKKEEPAEE